MGQCGCPACEQLFALCWTRLSDGTWVLSLREHLFAEPDVVAAVDPCGDSQWFLPTAPHARPPSEATA